MDKRQLLQGIFTGSLMQMNYSFSQEGLVSKKFALLKKPTSPSRFQTHPAAPELFGLCVIPAVFLKGGKNVSADNP